MRMCISRVLRLFFLIFLFLISNSSVFSQTLSSEEALEGETMTFTLTLDGPATQETTYRLFTTSFSAESNVDFIRADENLTFLVGEQVKTLQVTTLSDSEREDDEDFRVLVYLNSAYITAGVGTILRPINDPSLLFYVDVNANGNGDGSSWSNAFTDPQSAFDLVLNGDEVWIARGTYYPTLPNKDFEQPSSAPGPDERDPSFHVLKTIGIYGGFVGNETMREQRDPKRFETILDGNIGVKGDDSDNALTILFIGSRFQNPPITEDFVLDGFTLQNGSANLSPSETRRGDLHWRAGAIYVGSSCSPTISNCVFQNNFARDAATIYSNSPGHLPASKLNIVNCLFLNNTSSGYGAGVSVIGGEHQLTNCVFTGGSSVGGSALVNSNGMMNIANCLFTLNNTTSSIGAISNFGTTMIENSILWSNSNIPIWNDPNSFTTINNSIYDDGSQDGTVTLTTRTTGSNNKDFNPLLKPNFTLESCSPAINMGDNNVNNELLDFKRRPRITGGTIDIGPIEFQGLSRDTIYVNTSATGCNDGSSWTHAFNQLQSALEVAEVNSQIWVAQGTYKPTADSLNNTPVDPRSVTFYLSQDIELYGGFVGGETEISQRNIKGYPTILSGDIGMISEATDNAYHVVYIEQKESLLLNDQLVLDGFTIRDGYANNNNDISGGGIYLFNAQNGNTIAPNIINCDIVENIAFDSGGGMLTQANPGSTISAKITNCNFSSNSSISHGGGMFNLAFQATCTPIITNCSFWNNHANFQGVTYSIGGGIYNNNFQGICAPQIVNCSFSENSADEGGAVGNVNTLGLCEATITNSILWGNAGGELSNQNGGKAILRYSIYNDGNINNIVSLPINTTGNNNLDLDPIFFDSQNGDLDILPCSPAVNSGDGVSASSQNDTELDLNLNPRFYNSGIIDRGAIEHQSLYDNVIYVDRDAVGKNNGLTWENAYVDLQDAIDNLSCSEFEIWVAEGTYHPTKDQNGNIAQDPRQHLFNIDHNLKIYGGFQGIENERDERDWGKYPTILSGDIGIKDDQSDNSFTVMRMEGSTGNPISNATIVDGISIVHGNNIGISSYNVGGIYLSMTGAVNNGPTFENSIISDNRGRYGGGVFINGDNSVANPKFVNCLFSGNNAEVFGGAIYTNSFNGEVQPSYINCTFTGNTSTSDPAAIYNDDFLGIANSEFTNCIIWDNSGGITNIEANVNLNYSIYDDGNMDGNVVYPSGVSGNNNLDSNPLFDAGFTLSPTSPAIDQGLSGVNTRNRDLSGGIRVGLTQIDIGAYEYDPCAVFEKGIYVNVDATGNNDGTSWEDAFTSLQDALDSYCSSFREIWVAQGTYTTSNNRSSSFTIGKNVKLYGGFQGNETEREQRDFQTFPTILSGDIGITNDASDNNLHVLTIASLEETITNETEVDGFIISNGNANVTINNGSDMKGGGCYIDARDGASNSPIVRNVLFLNNYGTNGGAVCVDVRNSGSSEVLFSSCLFESNSADADNGGAILIETNGGEANILLENSKIKDNVENFCGGISIQNENSGIATVNISNSFFLDNEGQSGGAIKSETFSSGTTAVNLVNTVFSGNSSTSGGAISHNTESATSDMDITNCSFYNNTAITGYSLMASSVMGSNSTIFKNSVIWDNDYPVEIGMGATAVFQNCIINDGSPGNGSILLPNFSSGNNNLDINPLFSDTRLLTLLPASPAKDVGNNSYSSVNWDLAGNERIYNNTVDIGAYEINCSNVSQSIIYVDLNATGSNLGTSWTDAYTSLQIALDNYICGAQIWVAAGTYVPELDITKQQSEDFASFVIDGSTQMYGGFKGDEPPSFDLSTRDLARNETILSGNGLSKHVVISKYSNGMAVLDGFIIKNAIAESRTAFQDRGININHSYGAGLYNFYGQFTLRNCHFENLSSSVLGSAIYSEDGELIIHDTHFSSNGSNSSVIFTSEGKVTFEGKNEVRE